MIVNIGSDLVDARRINKAMARFGQKFLDRIFTSDEQAYAKSKSSAHLSYAKRFAAKEAVAKALGTGISGFAWTDIEITKGNLGQPEVKLYSGAHAIAQSHVPKGSGYYLHVSLSDEIHYAQAFVVFEIRSMA
jgi:holo-[acyl-carrier protein] synthase